MQDWIIMQNWNMQISSNVSTLTLQIYADYLTAEFSEPSKLKSSKDK